jgi:hypothetical protein
MSVDLSSDVRPIREFDREFRQRNGFPAAE